MNRKVPLGAVLAFLIIIIAVTVSITMVYSTTRFNETVTAINERENIYEKFSEIDRIVRQKYMGTFHESTLLDSVAKGYLLGIGDSYATYLSAEEFARLNQTDEQRNVGIGAVLKSNPDGYLLVSEIYPESPAQAEGLEVGDLIVRIDDVDVTIENSQEMLASIEAPAGTKIMLTVRRGAADTMKDITRREVIVPTVYGSMLSGTTIGYLRITAFTEDTANQFNRELGRLQNAGCTAVIFDLRDNAGGTLRSATRILDRMLPAGPLVAAVYKNNTVTALESSDANWIDLPTVTLANQNTAGEAELFLQVMKDYDATSSVGVTTAGRSMTQETIQLTDGSAIRITVARYSGPMGVNYEGVGIHPDYEVTLSAELGDWRALDYTTDPQLQKALEVATALSKSGGALPDPIAEQPETEQAAPLEEDQGPDEAAEQPDAQQEADQESAAEQQSEE